MLAICITSLFLHLGHGIFEWFSRYNFKRGGRYVHGLLVYTQLFSEKSMNMELTEEDMRRVLFGGSETSKPATEVPTRAVTNIAIVKPIKVVKNTHFPRLCS